MKNGSLNFDDFLVGCHRSGGYPQRGFRVFNLHPDITHRCGQGRLGLPRDHSD